MQNKNNEVELTIDDTIYTLEERIAQGGSGTVYRARAVDDEQSNVAIKIVRDSDQGLLFLDRSGDVRKGITRESGLLKRLNQLESQHYLTLLNEGHRDGSGNYCFVYEFFEGKTFDELAGTPFTQDEVKQIILNSLEGLEELHNLGSLHRDVKASNLMLKINDDKVSPSDVKIIDLGCSGGAVSDGFTTLAVSLGYCPPERVDFNYNEELHGRASDVYGLGRSLYRLFTGKDMSNLGKKLYYSDFNEVGKAYGEDVVEVIKGMCEYNPSNRMTIKEARKILSWEEKKKAVPIIRGREERYVETKDSTGTEVVVTKPANPEVIKAVTEDRESSGNKRNSTYKRRSKRVGPLPAIIVAVALGVAGFGTWKHYQEPLTPEQESHAQLLKDIKKEKYNRSYIGRLENLDKYLTLSSHEITKLEDEYFKYDPFSNTVSKKIGIDDPSYDHFSTNVSVETERKCSNYVTTTTVIARTEFQRENFEIIVIDNVTEEGERDRRLEVTAMVGSYNRTLFPASGYDYPYEHTRDLTPYVDYPLFDEYFSLVDGLVEDSEERMNWYIDSGNLRPCN